MDETQRQTGWRWGSKRWLVLLFILAAVPLLFPASIGIKALKPHIQLPAENLLYIAGDPERGFFLTNTLLATLIADVILILIALGVRRAVASGELVPRGLSGAVEAFIEVLYNLTESTAGKWAKTIFPWFATITLLVLVVNWMELIPGVDSIGKFDSHHLKHPEECTFTRVAGAEVLLRGDEECTSGVVPFVRVASTDLNFTVALALLSVVTTQVIGVRALGMGYFTKFWNTKTLFSVPMFGAIDFIVGILEIVAEFAKILSFSFRLFGNIFAGSVLLFVIGTLVPVFAQSMFLMLEFFVGAIQAVVFGMLTMVFMAQATQGHGDHH